MAVFFDALTLPTLVKLTSCNILVLCHPLWHALTHYKYYLNSSIAIANQLMISNSMTALVFKMR